MDDAKLSEWLKVSGLSVDELELILQVLRRNSRIQKAILFGSRAKGSAQPYSDIDIAIEGLDDELEVARIEMFLDELPLPYRFDVKGLDTISYQPLRAHIDRAGITIYHKSA
ncbi:MAG TPA: nucleotidyltransferase domain-containing protein [Chlorobaculum sp.]|nr:nucleotidyltransferase domain-containing protein [Chlorobaculum sp.]